MFSSIDSKHYNAVIEFLEEAILVFKKDKCTDCNKKAEELFGYLKEEVLGKKIENFLPKFQDNNQESFIGFSERLDKVSYQNGDRFNFNFIKKDHSIFKMRVLLKHLDLDEDLYVVVLKNLMDYDDMQQLIAQEKELAEHYLDIAGSMIVALDREGKVTLVNKELCKVMGYEKDELLGEIWFELPIIPDNKKERVYHVFSQIMKYGKFPSDECQLFVDKEGREKLISWSNSVLKDKQGKNIGTLSSGKDVTEERKMHEKIIENEKQMRQLVENIKEVFWIRDIKTDSIIYVSPMYLKVWGRTVESLLNDSQSFIDSIHPDDKERIVNVYKKMRSENNWFFDEEYRIVHPDGSVRCVWARSTPIFDNDNQMCRIAGIAEDITERKALEEKLKLQARTDPLTGTNNRSYFMERANSEFFRIKRYGGKYSVLMIDIDFFKKVNDRYGHIIGDDVLKHLVHISLNVLRESDIFGRYGGEEFSAILLETSEDKALEIAERLRMEVFESEITTDKGIIKIAVSIGVSSYKDNDTNFEQILNRADDALYFAKNSGRNNVKLKR